MKQRIRLSLITAFGLLAIAAAGAKDKETAPMAMGGGGMNMMEMMGKSDMSCMATADSLDVLANAVQDALKTEDKKKMKAALLLAQSHIAQMKGHMAMCKDMMGMMGNMMGGKMMGKEAGMGNGMATPAAGKDEASEHEKHHPN